MTRWIAWGAMAPLLFLEGSACAQTADAGGGGSLEFMTAQMGRRYEKVPHKVLAFYYTWYGTPEHYGRWFHWKKIDPAKHDISNSRNYPVRGAYDAHDPAVIKDHIGLAKKSGVDGFICTWWRRGDINDTALPKLLDAAAERDFEITIYWETVKDRKKTPVQRAVDDMAYVLEKYGAHPAFLKVDGKPVIFVYGRVMGEVKSRDWPAIISGIRERYGKDFLLIAGKYASDFARVFDGVHVYNIARSVSKKNPDEIRLVARESYRAAVDMARKHSKISCLTIIPGYDDTKNRSPGLIAERHGGETYGILWEEAIAADPDWILITTWNEWHEGSEIEPSHENGDRELKTTARYAPQFKKKRFSEATAAAAPPAGLYAQQAALLRELYKGKTIGVLPGIHSEAIFLLLEAGVAVKELADKEILDPSILNPANFPVIVNAGDEGYVQTIREKGDVDRALIRYLEQGGLLMALATKPFPFFLNEKRERANSAGKFGLPIRGKGYGDAIAGWEKPPADANLVFHVNNTILDGLPATAPFPEEGDRRWRPCTREDPNLSKSDAYLPLIQARDETGRYYGDGAAYIGHRASAPKNGKNIYVWMRLFDALDPGDLTYSIFRLAWQKAASDNPVPSFEKAH